MDFLRAVQLERDYLQAVEAHQGEQQAEQAVQEAQHAAAVPPVPAGQSAQEPEAPQQPPPHCRHNFKTHTAEKCLEEMTDFEFKMHFRFSKAYVLHLTELLGKLSHKNFKFSVDISNLGSFND